jgi:hypothetical protein
MERELSMENAELYATFTDNRAKRAFVPDITATNHPMTTKCIDTIYYGTAMTKTAIFRVKGNMKCPIDTLLTFLRQLREPQDPWLRQPGKGSSKPKTAKRSIKGLTAP